MKGGSVAKRYATALMGVAQEQKKLAQAGEDLTRFSQLVSENESLAQALGSPILAPSKKLAIFKEIAEKLQLSTPVQNTLKLMIERDRFEALALMVLLFRDLADEALGQVRVRVKVASKLNEEQQARLQEILTKSLKIKVLLEVHEDPSILGGLHVQVKDKIFDASLKHELEMLKQRIIQRAVA